MPGKLQKRALTLILFGAAALANAAAPAAAARDTATVNRPVRDKWALVVGISEFQEPGLKLNYAAKDARDFADYLIKEAGFAPDHVKLLTNKEATQRRILSELGDKWLPRLANPDDLVVIYISTHGSGAELDLGGQNYLIAYDTSPDDLYTTGIPMQRLASDIKQRIHCDRVVVLLDACHSGATRNGAKGIFRTGIDPNEFAVGSGQLVIASSKEDQISWESKKRQNSVFTAELLDALHAKGSRTSLGVMFATLKDGVQDTVLRERGVLQTPVMTSQWRGNDLILAAEPYRRRPGLETSVDSKKETAPPGEPGGGTARQRRMVATTLAQQPQTNLFPLVSDEVKINASTPDANGSLKTSALVVPGASLGKIHLSMTRADVLKLLGKPTEASDTAITYWSGDRKYFVSMHLSNNQVSEIAFSSPAFTTATGIRLSNYSKFRDRFHKPLESEEWSSLTLETGGFTVAIPKTSQLGAIGIVSASASAPDSLAWLPSQAPGTVASASTEPAAPVRSRTLIVPGASLGRTELGMSKADLLKLLGKPAESRGDVLIYRTADKKYYLAARFQAEKLSEVGFNSPVFATFNGLNVTSLENPGLKGLFTPGVKDRSGQSTIYTARQGGFSIVVGPANTTAGIVHNGTIKAPTSAWLP